MNFLHILRRNRDVSTSRDTETSPDGQDTGKVATVSRKKRSDRADDDKKTRRRRRSAIEVAEDKFIRQIAATNPELFAKIMAKRLGLSETSELENVARQIQALRKLERSLASDSEPEGDTNGITSILKAFATAAGQAVGTQLPAIAANASSATAAPASTAPPAAPTPQPPPAAPAVEAANPHLEALIAEVTQLSVPEAAGWLRSQRSDIAKQVVTALIQTPADRLPELVDRLRPFAPRGADLLAGRIGWLQQLAEALRAAAANESPL